MMLLNQFFELVRSGLWGTAANPALFAREVINWQALYRLSQQQTVIALVFDGLETLPEELRPPRALYMQWCAKVAQIEEANQLLNERVVELFAAYKEEGISPVLLKGQGMAACYLRPEHRQCGDIDLYFGKQCAAANRLMARWGGVPEPEESAKHKGFDYKGVIIENHRVASSLGNPFADRKFQRLVSKYMSQQPGTEWVSGAPVQVPATNFNVTYIFVHAFVHFFISGVGLRQVCDWVRLIVQKNSEIDPVEVQQQLEEIQLTHAAAAFGYVAVKYLGLPLDKVPFSIDQAKENGEILLKDILQAGNFGHHDHRVAPRPEGYWKGKWHTYKRAVKRNEELRRFAPGEAAWFRVWLYKNTLSIQWYIVKSKLKNVFR